MVDWKRTRIYTGDEVYSRWWDQWEGGPQVVGGLEWVSRCGGGRYKRSVSGRGWVSVYWAVVSYTIHNNPTATGHTSLIPTPSTPAHPL